MYRSGISEKCPEGDKWIEIPSPQVSITQLSVSPSGVVWGVTWEGVAVVRSGVSYYEPTGELDAAELFLIIFFMNVKIVNCTIVVENNFLHRDSMGNSCTTWLTTGIGTLSLASGVCWLKQCVGSNKGWSGDTYSAFVSEENVNGLKCGT